MKKLLLSLGLMGLSFGSFSQVICNVEEPLSIAGGMQITNPTDWSADLSNPANAVLDTVVMAEDSLACATLTNAAQLNGKIALVYRGTCNFSQKALEVQNAGAVACIIVNNIPGAPVGMGAGSFGAQVTIPVIMISDVDGDAIHDALEAGDIVVAFIGQKNGYFGDDLGFKIADVQRADANAFPIQLAQNASEFNTTLAGWVFNYGTNDQTGITLNATVNHGGNVYDQTSTSFNLLAGDSAFITLPDFNLASYTGGVYDITYTINYGVSDEYSDDNTITTSFNLQDSLYSLCRLDNAGKPITTIGTQPADNQGSFSSCITFMNNNGSRIGVAGISFSAAINAPDSLNGQEVIVKAIQWDDQFTDINDPNFGYTALTEIATASYFYPNTGSFNNVAVYKAFDQPILLEDGQRYLFCTQTFDMRIFFGYDEESSYDENLESDLQPFHPIESNGTYNIGGFVSGAVPSLAVTVFDAAEMNVNENVLETASFPNPAKDVVTVKVNTNGNAVLTITDLSGRVVSTGDVTISNGQFTTNVSEMNAGTYLFSLDYANAKKSQFKVVVTK